MKNWLECSKGNLGYLFVRYRKPAGAWEEALKVLWEKIYNQYIKEIGLTPDYEDLLLQMQKCAVAMTEALVNPSSINKTRAESAKATLDQMTTGEGSKFSVFVSAIEKYMGFRIDLETISVERFYGYVKMMQKESEIIKNGTKAN